MKMFQCTDSRGMTFNWQTSIEKAAGIGWELVAVGYEILDKMEVGETTIDDDGDTWERVE